MAQFELNVKVNGIEQTVSTIGQLEQALADTNKQLQNVDKTSKDFGFLKNQAQNLERVLGAVSDDAAVLNKNLGDVNKTTKELNTTFTNTTQAASTTGQILETSLDQATTSSTSLRKELRQVVQELQLLEPGSARFQELSVRAGELRDTIGDTNDVVTALAGNATERLGSALTGVVNIGVTGLQGVVGAMKLFGVESESAKQALEKLQGLLFVTQAIQGFGGLSDSIAQITAGLNSLTTARSADLAVQETSTAADASEAATTTINTAAQAANTAGVNAHAGAMVTDTVATEGATVATTGFTAALAANPIGLVVVGLTALISALFIFSDGQKTAKTNIDETNGAILEQSDILKQQTDDFIELYRTRKELEILQEKDSKKRAELEKELAAEVLGLQQDALEKQTESAQDANALLLDEFEKYRQAYTAQRQVLVREVAEYDEYGIFIGKSQEFRTETFKVGQGQLDDLRNRLATERAAISADVAAKKITQEEGRIKEEQATTRFYIDYLTKQKQFLKQSSKSQDETLAQNLQTLITSFQKTRAALEKALQDQIKIQQEAEKKQLEEQQRAAEQAQRERQAALDKAREQYKRAYDEIKSQVKTRLDELNAIEKKFVDDLTKSKFTTKLQEVEFEKEQEQEKLDAIIEFRKKDVQNSKVLGKEKQKLITQLETETKQAQDALDLFYFEKKKALIDEETKLREEQSAKLKQINDILQKELLFGDQNTADSRESLVLRERQLAQDQLDFDAKNNQDRIKFYLNYLTVRLEKQKEILKLQEALEIEQLNAENTKKLGNFEELLTKEFGLTELDRQRRYKAERDAFDESLKNEEISEEEYLKKVSDLNLKYNQDKYSAEKTTLKKQLDDNLITQEDFNKKSVALDTKANDDKASDASSLYQTNVNNLEESNVKQKEINQKFRNEETSAEKKALEDVQNYKLDKLDEISQAFGDISSVILGLFQSILDAQKATEDRRIQILKETNQQQEDVLNDRYNTELETAKASFDQGLINQEQYNKLTEKLAEDRTTAVNALNNKLNDETILGQKKLFKKEQNLKVAQAIVSGLQGAAQAFAGAFQLGPIAGPIVGAALAALVLATTGAQVAAIKKVKFDETSLSTNQPSSLGDAGVSGSGGSVAQSALTSTGGFTSFTPQATGGGETTTTTTTGNSATFQKVYVLESDITSAQDRVRVLEDNSTFG
jgi:hypothetical protein